MTVVNVDFMELRKKKIKTPGNLVEEHWTVFQMSAHTSIVLLITRVGIFLTCVSSLCECPL